MFPPSFYDHLEDRLNLAVYDINQEHRMGLADIKARLANIAGIENLTVEQAQGKEVYHLGEQMVEVPAGNAGVRNRVQLLAQGLSASPDLSALARVDNAVSALVAAAPVEQPKAEITNMSVSGLTQGILQSKLAELRQRGQERLAAGVAKIDAAHNQGLAKIDSATDDIAKKIDKEIDDTLHEFAQTTNGGPEL